MLPVCSDLGFWVGLWLKTRMETSWIAFLPPLPNPVTTLTALCSRHKALLFPSSVLSPLPHSDPLHVPFLPWGLIPFSISLHYHLENRMSYTHTHLIIQAHIAQGSFKIFFPMRNEGDSLRCISYSDTDLLGKIIKKNRSLLWHNQSYYTVEQNYGWC